VTYFVPALGKNALLFEVGDAGERDLLGNQVFGTHPHFQW